MQKVLVTGVNGFVGVHLVKALAAAGYTVIGTGLSDNGKMPGLASYFRCDLTSPDDVARLPLGEVNSVINLAGLAAVGKSFDEPDEYMRINTAVLSVLCDEIIKQGLQSKIRVLAISSGAVYDNGQPMPLTEDSKTNSQSSPYTASKLAMEKLAFDYTDKGLECIVVRPFNHIGPGQGLGFLLPDLYAQLKESLSIGKPMLVGNLTTQRDYTDVRDVVAAYVSLATTPKLSSVVYNVCSGTPRSGDEVLQALIEVVGKPVDVVVDQDRFRPSDAPLLYGDNTRLAKDIGWQPAINFKQTIADYVASVSG